MQRKERLGSGWLFFYRWLPNWKETRNIVEVYDCAVFILTDCVFSHGSKKVAPCKLWHRHRWGFPSIRCNYMFGAKQNWNPEFRNFSVLGYGWKTGILSNEVGQNKMCFFKMLFSPRSQNATIFSRICIPTVVPSWVWETLITLCCEIVLWHNYS